LSVSDLLYSLNARVDGDAGGLSKLR